MARRFFPDPKDYPQDNAQRAYGSRKWDDMSKNGLKRAYGSKSWDDMHGARTPGRTAAKERTPAIQGHCLEMPAPEGIGAKRQGELEGFAPRWIKGPAGHEHRVERPQKEKRPHPKAFCFEMPALPVLVPQAGIEELNELEMR